jgi:epsilon-lactone hydrolase
MDVRVLRTAGNCGTCIPQDYLDHWSKQYLGEADPYHPYASPMFGELHGLPPMLIQVGGGETMLDDAALFALKAGRARCQVR